MLATSSRYGLPSFIALSNSFAARPSLVYGEPCRHSSGLAQRLVWQEAVSHLLDVKLLRYSVTVRALRSPISICLCKVVKQLLVLVRVTVSDGKVVDLNDHKWKRVVALEREDIWFAPKLGEAIALEELSVSLLPKMSALA
eukprot:4599488-Pleurochrysis_carterae.AAC.1